jgi:hypothetical protein
MKKFGLGLIFVLLVGLFGSCASQETDKSKRPLNSGEQVIGTVQAEFELSLYSSDPQVNEAAYIALLAAAKKEFQGNIDVRDITWVWNGNTFTKGKYTATGKVISYGDGSGNQRSTATGVEGALARAAKDVLKNVPPRSRIAIVYITALDRSQTDYISGELEVIWVNEGYTIIDRSQLDRIRREQNFQMSGEVDDATAVSIGKIIGASIIVTGRVDGEGNLRRLRLRALNTQTAQVVGSVSERL